MDRASHRSGKCSECHEIICVEKIFARCGAGITPEKRDNAPSTRRRTMALVKRGKTWHTHFFVDGQRFRQSLETSDWREAQRREKQLVSKASQGKLAPLGQQFSKLVFKEAADKNLAERIGHLAPRSVQTERERLKPLCAVFGTTKLHRLSVDMVRTYMAERKALNVANKTINLELGVLRGVLKRAKLWHLFADEIKPLPVHTQVGRAMTLDEKLRLAKTAPMKPEWQSARLAIVLALNTTMRACEIKALRWCDVDFLAGTISIRRSKTQAGQRIVPLNHDALSAARELYGRASAVGGIQPDNYVFPACENGHFDPTAPQKSWRSAWRSLRKAAGITALRFHDLRHHAITELAESSASDATIMAIAGHVSRQMLEHYSHVRLDLKRKALDGLATRTVGSELKGVSYDTNYDTSAPSRKGADELSYRKDWSGREDLNLRPPGPEDWFHEQSTL
jgi:integrase